ncbi:MAG: UbiA family prenyltransferase [Chitinophagaceae bacterium]|nr:UbiA family prenyltransferase [Chitinophagaceae bacterium]
MQTVRNYLSLVKFSHTLFALPFALIGLFLGVWYEGRPFEWRIFVAVVLCMVFARSAAMAFNRYIDARYDKLNPRTAVREIPAGIIQKSQAAVFVALNCIFFILTTWFINRLCFYLSPLALFIILFYSYTKRFTPLCHLVLGVGLALAPIGAYLAVTGYFSWLPLLFSGVVITWVSGFDILYALQDEEFDRAQGLKSIPVLLGRKGALWTSIFLHALTALLILAIGVTGSFGWMYWTGASLFIVLLVYQHTLVKPHDISRVNMAFATTNGIASVVYAVFVLLALRY